jgi:hypothetical protein
MSCCQILSFLYAVGQEQNKRLRSMMNDDCDDDDDDNPTKGMSPTSNSASAKGREEAMAITGDKVKGIDSTREKPKKKQIRGKIYTTTENLMVCKAWVAASLDELKGKEKDSTVFEEEVGGDQERAGGLFFFYAWNCHQACSVFF